MVATDQNSSMISMMKKATGKDPTYAEIADAKVMLSRALSPHCSGLLVDGYYGYWSTVAAFAVPPGTGLLDPRREVRGGQEQGRRPVRRGRAGLGRRQDQAVRGRRGEAAGPVRAGRARLAPSTTSSSPARSTTSASSTTSCSCWSRSTSRTTARRTTEPRSVAKRKAKTVIESAKYLSRYCDVYKAEFPGTLGVETDAQLVDNLKRLNDACVEAVGAAVGRRGLRQVQEAGGDGDEGRGERRARRAGVLEGVLHLRQPGRAAEVRRDRVRPPGEGDRRDREDAARRGSPSTA